MYEAGVGVAFLIWLGSNIWLLIKINSQMERNLNKVGFRHSWYSLTPKKMSNNHYKQSFFRKLGKFCFIAFFGLLSTLLSWFSVLFFIGSSAYVLLKDSGAPQVVKEFRWRMRNTNMSFDEIVKGMALVDGNKVSVESLKMEILEEMKDRGNV